MMPLLSGIALACAVVCLIVVVMTCLGIIKLRWHILVLIAVRCFQNQYGIFPAVGR